MSLRLRLALSYIFFLVPALIAFSAVVYVFASARIYGALDDGLLSRIDSVKLEIEEQGLQNPATLRESLAALDAAAPADFVFKVTSSDGRVLYASSREAATQLPDRTSLKPTDSDPQTWGEGSGQIRVAYEAYPADGDPAAFVVGAISLKQTDAAIEELRGVFVVGAILVVLLTGAPAYYLAGRSLRPVREVAARAAEIERTGDFTTALPAPPSHRDEMADLVLAFNAMVERVRRMLVVQRDFLAHSSHELRRPLTVIRTYIDLLGHAGLSKEDRDASLQEMRSEVESMSRLISDLLVLSREEEQSKSRGPVDLSGLAKRVFARSRERAGTRRLSIETCPDAKVLGDADGLEQMVANLLDNAIQYTPERGSIDLTVARQNGSIRVAVTDSGIGIPQAEQAQVFERFFRGREALETHREGSGLGLVIVKHVAESHGGHVSFESQAGAGSTFVVELPALKDGSSVTSP